MRQKQNLKNPEKIRKNSGKICSTLTACQSQMTCASIENILALNALKSLGIQRGAFYTDKTTFIFLNFWKLWINLNQCAV